MEAHLKQLLMDLRERLSEALAESPEVGATLDELRRSGYAVQLLMDCKRDSDPESEPEEERHPVPASTGDSQTFRMTSGDLAFLRSVGIDPTRSTRGLRQRSLRAQVEDERSASGRSAPGDEAESG